MEADDSALKEHGQKKKKKKKKLINFRRRCVLRVKSVVRLLCLTSTLDGIESLPSMRSVNVCSEKALQSKENVCLKRLQPV